MAYSSTASWENGTRSGCLGVPGNGLSIHRKVARTRKTAITVRLEAALGLLLRGMSAGSGVGAF